MHAVLNTMNNILLNCQLPIYNLLFSKNVFICEYSNLVHHEMSDWLLMLWCF